MILRLATLAVLAGGVAFQLHDAPPAERAAADACPGEPGTILRTKRPEVITYTGAQRLVLRHAWRAIADGQPRMLTLERDGADRRRDQATSKLDSWGTLTERERRQWL